jgi:hypothetical protein
MWFLLSKSLWLQEEFSHLDIALAVKSLILPIKVVVLCVNYDNFAYIPLLYY